MIMYEETLNIEIRTAYNVNKVIDALKAELKEELEVLEFDANNTLPELDPALTFERIAVVKEIMKRLNLNEV